MRCSSIAAIFLFGLLVALPAEAAMFSIPELNKYAPEVSVETAEYASLLVLDVASGKILFQKEATKPWPAASLTKLMTTHVFTSTPTPWNGTANIVSADEVEGGRLGVSSGTKLSFKDLLYSTIVGSANNAANALARWFDSGSYDSFIAKMNARAELLGFSATHFVDASGISPDNTTTAYDIAILLQEAADQAEIQDAMVTTQYRFATRGPVIQKSVKNTNDLLFTEPDMIVTAGKTGFLYESEYNYAVRVYPKNNPAKELIVIVFGAGSRADEVQTSVSLARWAWDAFEWKGVEVPAALPSNRMQGDKGEDIQELQRFLNTYGYTVSQTGGGSPGNETTRFGTLTKAALKRFQEANSESTLLSVGHTTASGYLDFATRALIHEYQGPVAVNEPSPKVALAQDLTYGDRNESVRLLQELLARDASVYPEALKTGYFGPLTRSAVQRFQLKHHIATAAETGFGRVGPATRAKLAELYGS